VNLERMFLQIAVILSLCRVLHGLLRRLGQPPVIGEIIAGLLLGPSFLGWFAPRWYTELFPPSSLPALNGLSQIGLAFFMLLVGLRLNLSEVRAFGKVAGLSAFLSILVPFCAGLALARPLHQLAPSSAIVPFSLFIAVSMSITAFPVLARILTDQGLTDTRLGHVSIACAAVNDVAAWTLLAWITTVTQRNGASPSGTIFMVLLYGVVLVLVVRPILLYFTRRFAITRELSVMLPFAFLSSWATEWIGIHALFGAFFAGVIWPRSSELVEEVTTKLEPVAMIVLIPLFFSYTGIRTNIGLISGGGSWRYEAAILAVAIVAKMGGAFAGAMITKFGIRDSLALGALLNTRGLVELVALNVGLDLGILSPTLFSMMVLMALFTTLMTVPMLRCILPRRRAISAHSAPM
jgi:Kef-type K+ transport system membrane component KefB